MKINKKAIIGALKKQGFAQDDAQRCYVIVSDLIRNALLTGQPVHIQNVLKLYPKLQKPRKRHDHFHKRTVYVGECVKYRLKIFCNDSQPAEVRLEAVA